MSLSINKLHHFINVIPTSYIGVKRLSEYVMKYLIDFSRTYVYVKKCRRCRVDVCLIDFEHQQKQIIFLNCNAK